MSRTQDLVRDVRLMLAKPADVARRLGLKIGHDAGSYAVVHCPVHGDRTASLSLYKRDGIVRGKCHGCDWRGDVLDLVATLNNLEPRRDFREILATTLELAGMAHEAHEIRSGRPAPVRAALRKPEPEPERDYPPAQEVALLWSACVPVTDDAEIVALLRSRQIDPVAVARTAAAASLHPLTTRASIPSWARFKGRLERAALWTETGHRLILPVFDHDGAMRSVRAWLVVENALLPKRVPPRGHRASGLVLANERARRWLRGETKPSQIVVCEGEPDFLLRSSRNETECIIGVGSGSWTERFAERVPYGSEVAILTHRDPAGERYAEAIKASVESRARVTRWESEAA